MAAALSRLLVLDHEHRVLVDTVTGGLPEAPGALTEVHAALAARGLVLPHPAGSSRASDGRDARDFVFLVPPGAAPAGLAWVAFAAHAARVTAPGHAETLWSLYVDRVLGGFAPPTRALDVFAFGSGGEMAARLAHLVVCGDKRGTTAWVRGCELDGVVLPVPGTLSVVTDAFGVPRCVIRCEETRRLRFGDATDELARLEGEGDQSFADWRAIHIAFFTAEAAHHGLGFGDDDEIWFERFSVVHVVGRADRL